MNAVSAAFARPQRHIPAADSGATFATLFRRHIGPTLANAARAQGLLVALDRRDFSQAFDTVVSLARKKGAGFLPDFLHREMEGHIASAILAACIEFEPSILERRAIADRVASDIADIAP